MQNIQVRRYARPDRVGYQGTIEPADSSWLLFIPNKGLPLLWAKVSVQEADGKTVQEFRPVLNADPQQYWYVEEDKHASDTHTVFVEHKGVLHRLSIWWMDGVPGAPSVPHRQDGWSVQWLCDEVHRVGLGLRREDHVQARHLALQLFFELDAKFSKEYFVRLKEHNLEGPLPDETVEQYEARMNLAGPVL